MVVTAVALIVPALIAAGPTPAESLARLKDGNARFVSSPTDALPVTAERRTALAKGQTPSATILSCSDSRCTVQAVNRPWIELDWRVPLVWPDELTAAGDSPPRPAGAPESTTR
jgi:hypothetical protein